MLGLHRHSVIRSLIESIVVLFYSHLCIYLIFIFEDQEIEVLKLELQALKKKCKDLEVHRSYIQIVLYEFVMRLICAATNRFSA